VNWHLFDDFLVSGDTLRVYKGNRLLFSSSKDRLIPLLEYIDRSIPEQQVVILDKIMGNAAALLSVKAACRKVCSPLGSQIAVRTLDKYGIKYDLREIVPYIEKPGGKEMCPMEQLSIDKDPEEFYAAVKALSQGPKYSQ
jgi:hypothetical protein